MICLLSTIARCEKNLLKIQEIMRRILERLFQHPEFSQGYGDHRIGEGQPAVLKFTLGLEMGYVWR